MPNYFKRKSVWLIALVSIAVLTVGFVLYTRWSQDSVTDNATLQDTPFAQEYAGRGEYLSSVVYFTESGVRLVGAENSRYVIYPTNNRHSCSSEAFQDFDLIKQSADEVILSADHVGQTICFAAELDALHSPYQSIRIIGLKSEHNIKALLGYVLGQDPTISKISLSISRPDLPKPAIYVRDWHYRLSNIEMDCSEATDFENAIQVVGNQQGLRGYSELTSIAYNQWLCIRAEDLTGAYLYKQLQVTAPQLETVVEGDNLFVLYNSAEPTTIGYVAVDETLSCNAKTDFSQAQRLSARALKYGGDRILVKALIKDDNGQWFCLWGENRYGYPEFFTLMQVTGITASSDNTNPIATIRQLPAPDGSLTGSVIEIQSDELISYTRSKLLLANEPDCNAYIIYGFAGYPPEMHQRMHVIPLGRYSALTNGGGWVCYKLYDASENVGYAKFRYDLPPLAANDAIKQDDEIITIRGLGDILYLKFDTEPECHNALDWVSATAAQPNEEEDQHSIKIASQDYGQWMCLRRYYSNSSCVFDEPCPDEAYESEPLLVFYKYLIRDS